MSLPCNIPDKETSILLVCKKHYVETLIEELPRNPIYNLTDFSASQVLDNNKSVLTFFEIQTDNDELDLPFLDSKDA